MNESPWRNRAKFRSGVSFFTSGSPQYGWRLMVFCLLLVYVPFLGNRVIRTAGDDKVYVTQAVEMAERGNWFLQTMGGEPNYYKGPLHYLFLRVGIGTFGDSMWATVYMNLLLVILGAVALGAVVNRHMREFDGWSFWTGMAFALSVGVYSHVFASQMEVELAALFCVGAYLLDRSGPGWPDWKFWLLAGVVGWLKSPLHSVLLGTSALIFWAWQRELWPRMLRPGAWAAAIGGVAICALGYLPPYLLDQENFIATYVLRETLHKPANGAPWHYPIIPLFTYSLFPWTLPAIVAYWDAFTRLWRRQRPIRSTNGSKRVMALGIAIVLPSVLFFLWHPYRGQNYNLPVIGGLVLMICATWATRAESWSKAYSIALVFTALLLLVVPAGLTFFTRHFDPMPFWWPSWLLPVIWIGVALTARGLWREGFTFSMARPASMARRTIWLFLALGALTTTLGEREMIDVRDRIYEARKNNETLRLSYYNLQRNIWSEWGYLNFQIPYPVRGLFTEEQLVAAVRQKDVILVPGEQWLDKMKAQLEPRFPGAEWSVEPWRRWKTKGKNAKGVPAWREAWETRELSRLEKSFYLVRVNPRD